MKKLVAICLLSLLVACSGCEYGAAVLNNLRWGSSGMLQSILVNGNLSGLPDWIIGALINGAGNLIGM